MIAIKVGDRFLDLYPNTKIRLEFESNLLTYECKLPQSYSLPFAVPDTQNNRQIFKHLHLINSATTKVDIRNAQLLVARNYYRDCTIYCRKYSEKSYFINLYLNDSAVWDLIDEPIRRLLFGGSYVYWQGLTLGSIMAAMDSKATIPSNWNQKFVFPQLISKDYIPGYSNYSGYINAWNRAAAQYERPNTDNIYDAFTPIFFLKWVLAECFKNVPFFSLAGGINGGGSWWNEPGTNVMLLYNNYTISRSSTLEPDWVDGITVANHLPDISLKELIKSICELMNLVPRFINATNTMEFVSKNDIMDMPPERDLTHAVLRAYEGEVSPRIKLNFAYPNKPFGDVNSQIPLLSGLMPADVTFKAETLAPGYVPEGQDPPDFEFPVFPDTAASKLLPQDNSAFAGISDSRFTNIRLGYWRGLTTLPPPYKQEAIPHAAHYLNSPNDLADNFELSKLIPYRFGKFQQYMQGARLVKRRFKFNITDFLNFDIYKVYRIANVDFFVDKYVVELDMFRREIEVEAELWRL